MLLKILFLGVMGFGFSFQLVERRDHNSLVVLAKYVYVVSQNEISGFIPEVAETNRVEGKAPSLVTGAVVLADFAENSEMPKKKVALRCDGPGNSITPMTKNPKIKIPKKIEFQKN